MPSPEHPESFDLAIVGAGAAGLAAAIFAAQAAPAGSRIALIDSAKKPGAKILVSGGGRCNVTHHTVSHDDYQGPRNPIRNVLRAFNEQQTVQWFESIGVRLKQEPTGKLFPTTDSARTVLNALLDRCQSLHIHTRFDTRISNITVTDAGFSLSTPAAPIICKHLILASGGKSLPKTGSDGGLYPVVQNLGHTLTPTLPALVPLVLDNKFFHTQLSGISHTATLTTLANNKRIDRRTGSLLWTHFGISGPLAMDASRHYLLAKNHNQSPALHLALFTEGDFQTADAWLTDQAADQHHLPLGKLLAKHWPQRVTQALCEHLHTDPATPLGQLKRDDRRALAHALTDLPLPVTKDRGWNYAEVTAGGVPLSEIDFRTMQSRVVPNLYLVGELLDVDGRIGGFNFQWAWATGHVAGSAIAQALSA